MDEELAIDLSPANDDQWLHVWIEIDDQWHPPEVSTETDTL